MSVTIVLPGTAHPPTNVVAATTYHPIAGASSGHPIEFPIGTPVVPSSSEDHAVVPGNATSATTASAIGLASTPGVVGHRMNAQLQGPIALTTDQWDEITGGSGGLTRGAPYYLARGGIDGRLTATAPTTQGQLLVRVGIALSATDFLILPCCPTVVPDN